MVAVGSQGTANATVLGYVTVVLGPAFALVCGFGLLQRKAWGFYGVLALLFVMTRIQRLRHGDRADGGRHDHRPGRRAPHQARRRRELSSGRSWSCRPC
jgi:hypothetical protein